MSAQVGGYVVLAALLHATWNAILHGNTDRFLSLTWMSICTGAVSAIAVVLLPLPATASWPFIVASGLVHIGYNFSLIRAYQSGELGETYPISRGSSPVMVAVGAALIAQERLGGLQIAGVVLVSFGIISLALQRGHVSRSGAAAALLTGATIAIYTVIDGMGVRRSGDAIAYTAWIFLFYGFMPLIFTWSRGVTALRSSAADIVGSMTGGIVSLLAYGIVIWAMQSAAMGLISALRETSVVFAAIIGRLFLRERLTAPRMIACSIIALGAACIGMAQGAPTYPSVQRQADVMVAVRDGTQLATDIYRPAIGNVAASERLPVLLHRTPYDKAEADTVATAEGLARRGYVVIVQDTRGRHHSQGLFVKYYDYDAYDGYDTIEWAARLPYGNGKIGMYGTSYAAHTQADAAKMNPPHLRTLVLNMGGMSNAWDHSVRYDGAFEIGRQLTWAWSQALEDTKNPVARELLSKEKVVDWYSALPLRKGLSPLAIEPNYEGYYLDESTRSDYDAHWQSLGMQWQKYYSQTADIPMLHVGGWYDIYLRGTIDNYRSLAAMKKSPMRLLIGPWTHHGNKVDFAGDVNFGPAAAIADFDMEFHLRWFDFYLKGIRTAVAEQQPIRYFLMGTGDGHKDADSRLYHGGEWRDADRWPPPGAQRVDFYLHSDGTISEKMPSPGESATTTFRFDPARPVPTIGGGVSKRLQDGAYDQRERPDMPESSPPFLPLRARNDVLVFQTPPLQRDVIVAGAVEVTLYAASTGVDTDLTAKLVDVYPPSADFPRGFDMNLTDGILRASYRDQSATRHLMVPGVVYRLVIRPFDTANVFKKGHRIRLDVSSSNFPRFDVNPNTGEPLGMNRRQVAVDNTIYHEPGHPSSIALWLEPTSSTSRPLP